MKFAVAFWTLLLCSCLEKRQPADEHCSSADRCAVELVDEALRKNDTAGITTREQEYSHSMRQWGSSSVQALMPLLDHPDMRVQDVGAFALKDLGPLSRPAIPKLTQALVRGSNWAARALSATGDDAVVPSLVSSALLGRAVAAQALTTMAGFGPRAAHDLLVNGSPGTFDDLTDAANSAPWLRDLAAVVPRIRSISEDDARPRSDRARAVELLATIEASVGSRLVRPIHDKYIEFGSKAANAEYGALVADRYPGCDSPGTISDRDTWDERFRFVLVLASLNIPEATPLLTKLTTSSDWRIVLTSVRALARLGKAAQPAIDQISALAVTHWLPSVRETASAALMQIPSRPPVQVRDFDSTEYIWRDWVESLLSDVRCSGATKPTIGVDGWQDVGHTGPHVARDGQLTTTGPPSSPGELVWQRPGRPEVIVSEADIVALKDTPLGLVILHRPRTPGVDFARVGIVRRGKENGWTVRTILLLPGLPRAVRQRGDDGLEILTSRGVVQLVSGETVRRFYCPR